MIVGGMFRGGRAESLSEDVDFDEFVALDSSKELSILGWRELPLCSPLSEDGEIRTKGSETIQKCRFECSGFS